MQFAETRAEVGAHLLGALGELFVDDDAQRLARDGARQRIAAEGGAVVAGLEDAEDFF